MITSLMSLLTYLRCNQLSSLLALSPNRNRPSVEKLYIMLREHLHTGLEIGHRKLTNCEKHLDRESKVHPLEVCFSKISFKKPV